ncbi:hypothetical protein BKA66DRAFT_449066 [Pyrenochaeta sp. MPI-SDFR-AT-0127]|nr:hypothetical protein BKA66DRAFT_449066 [Pyrenochaeta sp. MPI-SDFR-AT-0127]
MSKYYDLDRTKSPSLGHDENADYQLALKLSSEWNDEQSAPSTHQPDYDADVEFALAMQLQYDNEVQVAEGRRHRYPIGNVWATSEPPSGSSAWGFGDDSNIAEYHPEKPFKVKSDSVADFAAYLKSSKCKCGEQLFRSELDITDTFQNWLSGNGSLSSWMKCRNCSTSFCFACTPEAFVRLSKVSYCGKQVSWCCAGGRAFSIWVLLCGFDQHFCVTKTREKDANAKPAHKSLFGSKPKASNKPSGGVGFAVRHRYSTSSMPSGMGYGGNTIGYGDTGNYHENSNPFFYKGKGHTLDPSTRLAKLDGRSKAESAQQAEDNFNIVILELLKDLLPSLDRDAAFDVDPPEAVTDMLVQSKILNYCAELLRNDSLDDATKRRQLYHALLSFLQTIGMHVMANRTLFSERPVQSDSVNLLTLSFRSVKGESKEMASSLADSLRNLTTQSVLVLQSAKKNEEDFHSEEGQNMLLLCRQISELSQHILAYTIGEPERNTATYSADLVISDVPDDQILATHKEAHIAKSLAFSPPGRLKRLITEISTLKTGLPPGIFIRYGETRPDVLKVAIIGPGGTPYENGIFEFDFFCGSDYPQKPPSVLFKGTGGGRVSINPNLYADGKVCLSLLGTWQGEPWKPGESTILQVVISLQAMIFCEEPWYNEPGREASYQKGFGHNAAVAYNQKIREHTVRYAMLQWLEHPPQLWQAVVDHHFNANANKILQAVDEWAKTKIPPPAGSRGNDNLMDHTIPDLSNIHLLHMETSDVVSLLPRLQTALQKFGVVNIVQSIPQPTAQQPIAPILQPPETYPRPPGSMTPLPLGPPPPYSVTQPDFPRPSSGPDSLGRNWSFGRMVGSGNSSYGENASKDAPNNRGAFFLGDSSNRLGRYKTKTATSDRDGPTGLNSNVGAAFGNSTSNLCPESSRGEGETAPRRGRGYHGIGSGSGRSFY